MPKWLHVMLPRSAVFMSSPSHACTLRTANVRMSRPSMFEYHFILSLLILSPIFNICYYTLIHHYSHSGLKTQIPTSSSCHPCQHQGLPHRLQGKKTHSQLLNFLFFFNSLLFILWRSIILFWFNHFKQTANWILTVYSSCTVFKLLLS